MDKTGVIYKPVAFLADITSENQPNNEQAMQKKVRKLFIVLLHIQICQTKLAIHALRLKMTFLTLDPKGQYPSSFCNNYWG